MTDSGIHHESFERDEPVRGSSDRGFGLVFTALFVLISLGPLVAGHPWRPWALIVAALFLGLALLRPSLLAPLNRLWTRFGLLLHRVTNPLLMGLVFFLAVTPTAFIMRLMGKDPLRLRIDRSAKSYWIDRTPPGPEPDTMRNQF